MGRDFPECKNAQGDRLHTIRDTEPRKSGLLLRSKSITVSAFVKALLRAAPTLPCKSRPRPWSGCGHCACLVTSDAFHATLDASTIVASSTSAPIVQRATPRYNLCFFMTCPVIHIVTRPPARCNLAPPSKSLRHCTVIVHTCTVLSRWNLLVMGKRHCQEHLLVSTSSREPRHVSHQHLDQQRRPARSVSDHSGAGIGLLHGRRALCGLGNLIRVLSCHAYLWLHDFLIQGYDLGHRPLQDHVVQATETFSPERERSGKRAIRRRSKHAVSCLLSNCGCCVRCSRKSLHGLVLISNACVGAHTLMLSFHELHGLFLR